MGGQERLVGEPLGEVPELLVERLQITAELLGALAELRVRPHGQPLQGSFDGLRLADEPATGPARY